MVEVERLVGVYSDPAYQIVHYPDGRIIQFVTCLFACRLRGGIDVSVSVSAIPAGRR
jgi:hypothetical protein